MRRVSKLAWLVVTVVACLLAAACSSPGKKASSSSSSASGSGSAGGVATASAPGITATSIKLGIVMPLSGSLVAQRLGFQTGVNARIGVANDAGGVNGRKITVVAQDDMGAAATNLSAAKELVDNESVFGILMSPVNEGAGAYLSPLNVPVIGWASTPAFNGMYKDYFGVQGASGTTRSAGGSITVGIMQKFGATVAMVGSHDNNQSVPAAEGFIAAAKAANLKVGYTRLNYPLVPGDFTADGQSMAAAHVDAADMPLITGVASALYTAGLQAGVKWKAFIFPNAITDQQAAQLGPTFNGALSQASFAPLSASTDGTKALNAAVAKYGAAPSGAVDAQVEAGWIAADVMINGLKAAGINPTRDSVVSAIHSVTSYNAGGMIPQAINYSAAGTDAGLLKCSYIMIIKDGKSVLAQPDPICGTVADIPSS